jgi:hypothetical protein
LGDPGQAVGILSNDAFYRTIKLDEFYAVLPSLNGAHNPGYCEAFKESRKRKLDFQFLAYRELGWNKSGHAARADVSGITGNDLLFAVH